MKAAADWVQRNSTLLKGFSLQLTIADSKCDPNHALKDFGGRLRSAATPDVLVGVACSSVAVPLTKIAAAMRIPTVCSNANTGDPLAVSSTLDA